MSCEVAALPFQAHAKYGTWSIDFVVYPFHGEDLRFFEKLNLFFKKVFMFFMKSGIFDV